MASHKSDDKNYEAELDSQDTELKLPDTTARVPIEIQYQNNDNEPVTVREEMCRILNEKGMGTLNLDDIRVVMVTSNGAETEMELTSFTLDYANELTNSHIEIRYK